jgi:hypothetical protein
MGRIVGDVQRNVEKGGAALLALSLYARGIMGDYGAFN